VNSLDEELEAIGKRWDSALSAEDMERALGIAFEGYEVAKKRGERQYQLMFLGFIRHAGAKLFDALSERKSEPRVGDTCSFCRQRKSRMVRGMDAAICSECIEEARTVV